MIHRWKGLQKLYPNHPLEMSSDLTGSRKPRWQPPNWNENWYTCIILFSACKQDWNEISMAISVSWSRNPMTGFNDVRPNRKWEIQDGGCQTENTHMSARKHDSKTISTARHHSNRSRWIAGPRKHWYSRLDFVPVLSTSWDIGTSCLKAAIFYFSLPVWSYFIHFSSIGSIDY